MSGSPTRISALFVCAPGVWLHRFRGPRWDERTLPMLYSPTGCRAAYGLDFAKVAWHISRTVRSAHGSQTPAGWEEAASTGFNSMGTARSGPQRRAG